MEQPLTWVAIIGSAGSIIAFVTFWMKLATRITKAEDKSEAAHRMADAVNAKIDMRTSIADDLRSKTGERIAVLESLSQTTAQALISVEGRLVKSIEDLGEKLESLQGTIISAMTQAGGARRKR